MDKPSKNLIFVSSLLACLIFVNGAAAQANPIPVSVTAFEDRSGSSNCRFGWDEYWHRYLGQGFKEMLMTELSKSGKVKVLERENIRTIYSDEHELVNAESDKSLKRGKFKKAMYTFAGAVTEFEYCAQETGGSINVGGVARMFGVPAPDLNVGKKGAKARLAVDVRIIDVTTGEIVSTVRTEGEVEDSRFTFDTNLGNYKDQSSSPMGKAARIAISKAAAELNQAIR